jgi:flagellar basal body-associated protein FliL
MLDLICFIAVAYWTVQALLAAPVITTCAILAILAFVMIAQHNEAKNKAKEEPNYYDYYDY